MAINKNVFLHESDKVALNALQSIPGFTPLLKAFMKIWNEKLMYIQNMATNVRVDDNQLKKYHDMLIPICDKLGIDVPDLFLTMNVVPNAWTSGDTKPYIVITSGLLETMPEEIIPTVLAHECGHIACHHVLYRTMGQMILSGAIRSFLSTSLIGLISQPILLSAFAYWMRCSELSADRAAILCDGTPDKVMEMCMRFAGFDKDIKEPMNLDAFMSQAREYRKFIKDNGVNQAMEFLMYGNESHPINAVRALEALEWAKSDNFNKSKQYFDAYKKDEKPEEFPISWNEKHFIGRNYEEVVKELEDLGFDVDLSRSTDKNILLKDGNVTNVLINGSTKYKDGDWFNLDAKVEVRFYKPLTEEEISAMHPGEVKLPNSSSYYIGKNYKEVEMELFEAGIVNTKVIRVYNNKVNDKQIGKVCNISIDDKNKFNKGDWISIMSEVSIEYNDFNDELDKM